MLHACRIELFACESGLAVYYPVRGMDYTPERARPRAQQRGARRTLGISACSDVRTLLRPRTAALQFCRLPRRPLSSLTLAKL